MQKCGENIREENGGNIDSNCFVGRKFLWKKRGKGKRKFVVIIWKRWKNREERKEIRAVFAPRQAVYSSKLYLMFPMPVTSLCPLPSILHTSHACSLHFVHVSGKPSLLFAQQTNHCSLSRFFSSKSINQSSPPQQTNQSHFTVWQSFILQFGNLSFYSLAE